MRRKGSGDTPVVSGSNSDLARLIETEQRLGERLEEARRECETLRQRARQEVGAAGTALEQELATLTTTLAERCTERLRLEIGAVEREGRAAAERYASLGDPECELLAKEALRQLRAPIGGNR